MHQTMPVTYTETAAGLRDGDEGTFKDAVLRKCPWYHDVLDVFKDRASAKPKVTSDNLDGFTEEDEESEGSDEDHDDSPSKNNNTESRTIIEKETGDKSDDVFANFQQGFDSGDDVATSDKENEVVVPSTPAATASKNTASTGTKSSRPLSVNKKSRKPKKKAKTKKSKDGVSDNLGSDEDWMSDWKTRADERRMEQKRHNGKLEEIAKDAADKAEYQHKQSKLDYHFNLHEKYQSLRKTMSTTMIASTSTNTNTNTNESF